MATDPSVVETSRDGAPALHEREFSITRRGYDREEVRAYLAEIEVNLCELEAWARRAKARLAIAEEKDDSIDEVDKAMMAVFEAKERVLAKARLQAERIEAAAMKKARADAGIRRRDHRRSPSGSAPHRRGGAGHDDPGFTG